MYQIYDTNGDLLGFYDDNMLAYNPDGSPMMGADGLQMEWTGSEFLTQSEVNFAATGTTDTSASSAATVSTVNSYTPPSTFDPNAIVKLLNGQTFKYDATGANPVPYNASAPTMSKWLLWGGLGLVGYIALSGSGGSSRGRGGRR